MPRKYRFGEDETLRDWQDCQRKVKRLVNFQWKRSNLWQISTKERENYFDDHVPKYKTVCEEIDTLIAHRKRYNKQSERYLADWKDLQTKDLNALDIQSETAELQSRRTSLGRMQECFDQIWRVAQPK